MPEGSQARDKSGASGQIIRNRLTDFPVSNVYIHSRFSLSQTNRETSTTYYKLYFVYYTAFICIAGIIIIYIRYRYKVIEKYCRNKS